ncbi:hypothetical protein P4O66_006224 [Electrophorus voltai]|uniref:Uncharacterized protein n=1 Tax=Electrophorus voltai TaxID=2609070 RepID=A0AAD8ZHV3_9TELE|nr:hypothetical protein P4O66_006224 [Electrophorus voltai]
MSVYIMYFAEGFMPCFFRQVPWIAYRQKAAGPPPRAEVAR